jgi:hypothetical protein
MRDYETENRAVRPLGRDELLLIRIFLAIGYWLLAILQLARGPNVPPSNPCGRMIKTAIISTSE